MKPINILLLNLLFAITITSCGCTQSNDQIIPQQHNYVVVLDLSDRLLNAGQSEKDSGMIQAVFNEFEKKARSPLIVSSNDRFSVRIIPQKGSALRKDFYENKLNLDLSAIDAAHKNSSFVAFKDELSKTISALYSEAHLGNSSKDYAGVDIWKFFNDEINTELRIGAENKVVVLTDGYFDFNDNTHVLQNRNRYTSTTFLKSLNGKDWQAKAEHDSIGLMPVSIKTKAHWVIAGIQAKNTDILMPSKLMYFWKKWLVESGADSPKIILDNASTIMANQYSN